ncbi:pyrroline-5-carboxylate reductase [Bacillus pakistanensis]|uniref:Pyrroline-5-carboxylate reductase n=1 Tax=Rossellomorea pakistanensis TaxID=992288 RepID=A0ABS2NJ28_9BACI|nr:NAD(P)-binding domain-containing protein [Bacillus pakistanensis]MBM7587856.1 pyrroline-5-carboxylate reductase [Bacillus pakistanensis]
MKQNRIGLAGIGKLGSAMMKHWCDQQIPIGVYHPNKSKAEQFISRYSNGYLIKKEDINELTVFILALPSDAVVPFISQLISPQIPLENTCLINMATALTTNEVSSKFPALSIAGMKFMGHSTDLYEHGNGLFITEHSLPDGILELFRVLGEVKRDSEEVVINVNKSATYQAVKAAIELEKEFAKKNLPAEYKNRALTSLFPEVIRSYSKGTLGHFAIEIVNEIKNRR